MKHIAHPIIGDATHGKGRHNRFFKEQLGCDRLLLANVGMRFRHPASGSETTIRAGIGDAFAAVLTRLGWPAAAISGPCSPPDPSCPRSE